MSTQLRHIRLYKTPTDVEPFTEWLDKLRDRAAVGRIRNRLANQVEKGNFGDHRGITDSGGVSELRFFFGPGYRVYDGEDAIDVVLLTGGDQSSQDVDTRRAKGYWEAYKNAKKNQ